ncbi:MAG: TIGR00730 family Rossman fold protein [Sediminicola sp.]
MKAIVVFCGSNEGKDPVMGEMAYGLGRYLAENKINLVYGGARIGIMGKVAQGALDHRGTVIGVIPDFLKSREVYHTGLSRLIVTENMHQRKLEMHELSDGIITLPGGCGTMEELFEMVTWGQLGLHHKPIGILNINGFYDCLLQFLEETVQKGFVKQEHYNMLLVESSIEGLLEKMGDYKPPKTTKWINKDQV